MQISNTRTAAPKQRAAIVWITAAVGFGKTEFVKAMERSCQSFGYRPLHSRVRYVMPFATDYDDKFADS